MEDKLSGLDGSETFVDMAWYTDDDGETVNYGNAVVGQVMSYYSGQVDSKNEESGGESVTYGINTLRIGRTEWTSTLWLKPRKSPATAAM